MAFHPQQFLKEAQENLAAALPQGRAVVACSGGVDSTVCAVLAHRTWGARVHAVFLDTGFMRAGEAEAVRSALDTLGIPLEVVPCAARFFEALRGVRDPEEKRRRFRAVFYTVLAEILAAKEAQALVQGTIAADVRETQARLKTHHNVLDGVPDCLPPEVAVLEPLRDLLKPEVRVLALHLGLPREFVDRRPFPGPGLAIRVAGGVTPERVDLLRRATKIVEEETADLPAFQAFPILLEEQATGVREGSRVLGPALVLRCVASENALSARALPIPWERLMHLVDRLLGELPEVGRVLYDLTPKPPATVEWE